jgi:hypothetical protein
MRTGSPDDAQPAADSRDVGATMVRAPSFDLSRLDPQATTGAGNRDDKASAEPVSLEALIFAQPGKPGQINRFAVLRLLGAGGMGVVYAAYDEELDRRVAIKVLRDDRGSGSEGRSRMLREAQAMAKLSHANVVQVYEVGEFAGQIFMAMEFVKGKTLHEWLAEEHSWEEILAVFVQAGHGLAAAHRQGIVHRDFKPKSRRPSQTAPQPTDRPHSHSQGRFERVDVDRAAPGRSGVPQVLAKRWQRAGPLEDQRGHAPRHSQERHHEPFPSHPFATAAPRAAAGR